MKDRFHPVVAPELKPCRPPFSFFRFLNKYWPGEDSKKTLHRVFSLMRKMHARTVTIEELARRGELAEELDAVETRCGGAVGFQAWRFSFFRCALTEDLLPYAEHGDYLGYAVLLSLELPNGQTTRYLYESVVATPSVGTLGKAKLDTALPTHYVHCVRKYSGWVASVRFDLYGSFFSQQNGLTNVCAHASLRWLLNNLPDRAESMESCEIINAELGIDHEGRRVGLYGDEQEALGLRVADFETVLENRNWKYLMVDYRTSIGRPQSWNHLVYSVVESGYPVLVFFRANGAEHVICVIGHTLNTDIWDAEARFVYAGSPNAEYLSTGNWADHFIIHDDNYGMYFCMSRKALSSPTESHHPFEVTGALGILPAQTNVYPLEAQLYASLILAPILDLPLATPSFWLSELRATTDSPTEFPVLRTLFVSQAVYREHLRSIEDPEGNFLTEDQIATIVPDDSFFWIVEVSLTDVYTANKRKLGEVLLAAQATICGTQPEDDPSALHESVFGACRGIRLPDYIIVPEVGDAGVTARIHRTGISGHVPLLRMCRASPAWEW